MAILYRILENQPLFWFGLVGTPLFLPPTSLTLLPSCFSSGVYFTVSDRDIIGQLAAFGHLHSAQQPFKAMVYSIFTTVVGLILRSKLAVIAGYIYIVITINVLAVKVRNSILSFFVTYFLV